MKREHTVHADFMKKMIRAKQMEREAFLSLVPDTIREHTEVIEREVKAIITEVLLSSCQTEASQSEKTEQRKKVRKVTINGGETE